MTPTASPAAATDPGLGFTTLEEEVESGDLPVAGELPAWLRGRLVRVTPAVLDPAGEPVRHWFDGLAMLHAFGFGAGTVTYANRLLETGDLRDVREHGEVRGQGFATDPCRSIFSRVSSLFSPHFSDNCNVNVVPLGERWLSMTETPIALEFDPDTLETLGPIEWRNELGAHHVTAHPHHDGDRGEMLGYVAHFSRTSSYRVFAVPDGSRERRVIASLPVKEPAYMHSFALTPRYAVLIEQPLVVNPLKLALGGRSFIESYEWKPERGTRFLVVDRESGDLVAEPRADAFFTFHTVNAYEEGGELVVDLVAHPDASVIDELYLARLRDPDHVPAEGRGKLRRFRLPLAGGEARAETLNEGPLELPRIAYRSHNGERYRYAYAAGDDHDRAAAFTSLVKVDVEGGSVARWREEGCYPGEPVFVPAPDQDEEDDGILLSVVLDARAGRSFLLALDARGLEELARAEAPHHIPFGFHGAFSGKD